MHSSPRFPRAGRAPFGVQRASFGTSDASIVSLINAFQGKAAVTGLGWQDEVVLCGRSRVKVPSLAPLVAILVLGAPACGGEPASETSGMPDSGKVSSPEVSNSETAAVGATAFLIKIANAMEAQRTVRFDKESPDEVVRGALSTNGAGTDAEMNLSLPTAHLDGLRYVIVGGTSYLSLPAVTGKGKYAKLNPGSELAALASVAQGLRLGSSFKTMAPAVEKVQDLGAVEIDGTQTEHYILLIDSAKSHALLNPGLTVPGSVASKIPKIFRYEIFVTSDSLVRRVRYTVLGKKTVLNYTDWGSRVLISPPPASAIVATPPGL